MLSLTSGEDRGWGELDADLNHMAVLQGYEAPTPLTPHPMEICTHLVGWRSQAPPKHQALPEGGGGDG